MSRLIKGKMIRKRSRRMFQRNIVVLFCFMLLFSPFSTVLGEIVEDDITEAATEITNLAELNEVRNELDGNYILGADIDLSEVTDWQSIGTEDEPFNGVFDGSGFKLTGMDGAFEEADHGGIFNAVSADATVQKLVVEFRKEVVEDEEVIKTEEATEDEEDTKTEEVTEDTSVNEEHTGTGENTPVGDEGEEELSFRLFGGVQPLANGPNIAIGDGIEANPYIIMNETELNEVRHGLNMYFELGQSIVLTNANWEPIGNLTNQFTGSFDGKGHTISNLTINRPNEEYIGLFGSGFEATISNITLTNVSIVGDSYVGGLIGRSGWGSSVMSNSVSGQITGNRNHVGGMVGRASEGDLNDNHASVEVKGENYVGGLIGSQYLFNGQYRIIDSSATGNVSGKANVGGLIGQVSVSSHNDSITISHSFATGNVTGIEAVGGLVGFLGNYNKVFASHALGTVTGDMRVGGLVGNNQGEIQRSFASGNIEGSEKIGGLVGFNSSNIGITNSYATGVVDGDVNIGGLVGENTRHSNIKMSYATGLVSGPTKVGGLVGDNGTGIYNVGVDDSYYDKDTSNQSDDTNKGVPKSTLDMQTQATFTNWDFDDVWDMPAEDYPRLQWEGVGGQPPVVTSDIIYVKENGAGNGDGTGWDNAFATLQEALDEATDGKQIWIAKGTYYPTKAVDVGDDRTKTFQMNDSIAIYGGFEGNEAPDYDLYNRNFAANETILSGDLGIPNDNSDNAYHVVINENIDGEATINGVTIQDGNANGATTNFAGGGIRNIGETSTLNLEYVVIQNNHSKSAGGGVYNDKATINASGVTIMNNTSKNSGGGISNSSGSIIIQGGLITKNTAAHYGGGISNWQIKGMELIGTEISYNEAVFGSGGIHNNSDSSPIIHNSIISYNETEGSGGGISNNDSSNPELVNVLIMNNEADNSGGGLYNTGGSSPNLTNITIIGNSARIGGAMFNNSHPDSPDIVEVTLNNSIVWGNMSEIAFRGDIDNSDSTTLISNSLIENSGGSTNWDGRNGTDHGNNIDAEPRFVDPTNDNYQLQASSPAINAGNDDFVPVSITTDLSGNTRIFGTSVDMGAYEFQGEPIDNGGDVTAVYVDEDNNEIAGAETYSGNVGETYTTIEKAIDSYTLTVTPANATGTFTADAQKVKYVYTKDTVVVPDREITSRHYDWVPLKTGWYDINNLPLREKVEVSLDDGSKVELAINWNMDSDPLYDKDKEGSYLFSGEFVLVDGVSNPKGYKAQRQFVLSDVVVTVTHVDEDGNELASEEKFTGKVGDEYTTEAKDIDGYKLTKVPEYAAGKFRAIDLNVKYVYTKDEVDIPDKEITGSLSRETMFDVGAKELADINTLLPTKVTVTLDDNTEVELNVSKWDADSDPAYNKDTVGMYVFSGDIELTDGIANSAGIRAKFSVSLNANDGPDPGDTDKEITGFKWNGTTFEVGTKDRDNLPLPDKVQVTLDDDSKVDLVVDWEADSETPYDMNTVGTYIFNGDFKLIDGVVNSKGFKAKFNIILKGDNTQIPEPSVVIITHVDEEGNELAPSKTLTGFEGEMYQTQVEVIKGYTFNKVNGDASGTFTKASIFVEYVYEKDTETPDPVDPPDETDPVETNKEITNVPVMGTTYGLGAEDLANVLSHFPSTIKVTLDDGTIVEVGVKWNEISKPVYDKNQVGAYVFSGELILTEGIANTANHMMIHQVNVFDYDKVEPTDPKEPEEPKVEPSEPTDKGVEELKDSKVTVDSDKVNVVITTDDDSTKLPKTATPYYTILLGGLLLMIIGGATYFLVRKKRAV